MDFAMGAVGPDGDDDGIPLSSFVPKQAAPNEDLKSKAKLSSAVGGRIVKSVIDVMDDDEKLEFIVNGILPNKGLMYIGGLSGTGKTIQAIQLVGDIVLGRPTMTWQLGEAWTEDFVGMMLSLEMGKTELQLRLQHMYPNLTDDERKSFDERFLSYTEPEPFELWNPAHILDLFYMIKAHGVKLLLIDSASVSFAQSLKDDVQVNESIKNLYMLRNKLGLAMVVVSHTRKPPAGIVSNPEDITLNDLFGHSGVAQSASSILIMMEDEKARKESIKSGEQPDREKVVHIIHAKSRFGASFGAFKAHLTSEKGVSNGEPLMFRRNAIPIAMTDEQRAKIKSTKVPDLSTMMQAIDFTSILSDEEDE